MISALAAPALALGLLAAPHAPATVPPCTRPAIVNDGLIELTCFPVIPAKQFPPAGVKCNHISSWVTGHSTETVNGQRYRITQKVRDDVLICRA